MNILESEWLGSRLAQISDEELFPFLNVGSSTRDFRARVQPHIDKNIFALFEGSRRQSLSLLDLKGDDGVDIVGNFQDPALVENLASLQIRSIMVSNLLEHVTNPTLVCDTALKLIPHGGYVILSGPRDYPFHADPDRHDVPGPSVEEIHSYFPKRQLSIVPS